MNFYKNLEKIGKNYLSNEIALFVKKNLISYPRYFLQIKESHDGFNQFGHLYSNKILFIAGLPKSGTSWLKKMLSEYPGYHEIMLPEANKFEINTGGSHNFELPLDTFTRFKNNLIVLKLHVHGSDNNVQLLTNSNIPFIVIYRDLRDVALSYYFYVKQTPWHPEYQYYSNLDVQAGLKYFSDSLLCDYVQWIESWEKTRNNSLSLILRYEDLLARTETELIKVVKHLGLDISESKISSIIRANSFETLSGGRNQGRESQNSFFRKGIAGDWKNYFDEDLKKIYKENIGEFLIKFKYENDLNW